MNTTVGSISSHHSSPVRNQAHAPAQSAPASKPSEPKDTTTLSHPETEGQGDMSGMLSAMRGNFGGAHATINANPFHSASAVDTQRQANEDIYNHFNDFTHGGNAVSQADLKQVAGDSKASAGDKAAAQYYLGHSQQLGQLENDPRPESGTFTKNDVGYAREQQAARDIGQHFGQLDTAAQGGKPDGIVSKNDLKAALQNKNLDPNLRDSLNFLLNTDGKTGTDGYFGDLDTAHEHEESTDPTADNLISRQDLSAVLDPNRQFSSLDYMGTFAPSLL